MPSNKQTSFLPSSQAAKVCGQEPREIYIQKMHPCSHCNRALVTPQIDVDRSLILEKLRWESGPASVQPTEVALILQRAKRDLKNHESEIHRHLGCPNCSVLWTTNQELLQAYVTEVQSLLSPIRKIPDEILRFIFHYCDTNRFLVSSVQSLDAIDDLRDKPALAVSSVCSRWRRNGLSMPSLWSRVLVDFQRTQLHEMEDAKIIFALNKFFTRSLPSLLDLTVRIGRAESHHTGPVLTHLVDHTHRWRNFTYFSEAYNLYSMFVDDPLDARPTFPFLEDLEIIHVFQGDLSWFTDTAPRLKSLILPGSISPVMVEDGELQALFDVTFNLAFLKIEEACKSDDGYWEPSAVPISITSSTIDTLSIWNGDHGTGPSVFKYFKFPSLQNLHLEPSHHFISRNTSSWVHFDPFMAFVQRSSFPLTTLSIQSLALSDSNLVQLLIQVPTLSNLTLNDTNVPTENSPITVQLVESLHPYRYSPLHRQTLPISPRLCSLTLNVGANTFEDKLVIEMVQSRWIPKLSESPTPAKGTLPVDCLREFTMWFRNREEVKGVYQPLVDIRKEGIKFVVMWKI
ncbi:hypothetical protein BT96DRAFT_131664 [Gymnopus androsaceus JB14]|uniref:Uncharacterized protein n=1 Tax=Gymnopus androsaceus JB14 TaxID=1447944 RepID=A0A6A4IDN2_9AGAR|nr:hypothetical protein BT96DRAFT_131664 [Gymnopus androsaceus JB14]